MTAAPDGPHPTWSSPLATTLRRFLESKRAAGYRYRAEAQGLGVLDRFLRETLSPTDPVITRDIVRAFVARRGTESETTRAHRLTLIREVCRFVALDDPRTFLPEARFLGIHRHTSVPRVLSLEEGRRFLDACDTLNRHRSSPRRELVLRTLLVLLYLTGLRAGEALRLTQADIDLETAVLRIRDTKFGKSRLVPLAVDVATRLAHCRHTLAAELGERTPGAPFFPAPSGQPYSISALRDAFHAVLAAAKIPRRQGGRPLRLHDLRHSFAVLRLTLWYRQQASPGNLLPALATYLGHVGIASSQRYLQLTEDVAANLTRRYATRFGHLVSDGGPR